MLHDIDPMCFVLSTGGGRTGTFIAAYTILERLKDEQMIDVFQVVRRIRKTRPKFVENKVCQISRPIEHLRFRFVFSWQDTLSSSRDVVFTYYNAGQNSWQKP